MVYLHVFLLVVVGLLLLFLVLIPLWWFASYPGHPRVFRIAVRRRWWFRCMTFLPLVFFRFRDTGAGDD